MSDLKANFDKLNNACKEANEEWKKMTEENNLFDTTSKIAKDIADKRDKEMALEFAKYIGELFRENGVTAIIEEYRPGPTLKDKNLIEEYYGVAIAGLDFAEHDKKFKDEITQLKHDTKEMEDKIAELESELEVKENLMKIKNGLSKNPNMTVIVAKTINGQDYVKLEDFMSVMDDLQNCRSYNAE